LGEKDAISQLFVFPSNAIRSKSTLNANGGQVLKVKTATLKVAANVSLNSQGSPQKDVRSLHFKLFFRFFLQKDLKCKFREAKIVNKVNGSGRQTVN
jgi:hypothetical protein